MLENKKVLVVTAIGVLTERVSTAVIEPLHITVSQFDNHQVIDVAQSLLGDHMHKDDIEAFYNDAFSYLEEFTDDESDPSITLLWRGYGVNASQGDPIVRLHLERVFITAAAK